MVDIVDRATRSRMMSGIRAKDTKPEMLIRKMLHGEGFRFRLHVRELPGKPDIVLPRYRAVIFVHGCFWHGHDCPLFKVPATRRDFWLDKINRNRINDLKAVTLLTETGWRVASVWECSIRQKSCDREMIIHCLTEWIKGQDLLLDIRGNALHTEDL